MRQAFVITRISRVIYPITSSINCPNRIGFRPVLLSPRAYPDRLTLYHFAAEKTRMMMPITATVVNPIVATIDISIQYLPYMIIA